MLKTSIDYRNAMGNRYKEIVYEEVEYDALEVIMERIVHLDKVRKKIINDLLNSI